MKTLLVTTVCLAFFGGGHLFGQAYRQRVINAKLTKCGALVTKAMTDRQLIDETLFYAGMFLCMMDDGVK